MPRTKAPKNKKTNQSIKAAKQNAEIVLKLLQLEKAELVAKVEQESRKVEAQCASYFAQGKSKFTSKYLRSTVRDINAGLIAESTIDTNSTFASHKTQFQRSHTSLDDEGYLTAGSGSSTKTRTSRQKARARAPRLSRSVPRNQKIPANSYGTITPKVAPNTPQVLLRRPKLGEMALSLQGSPIFTGPVIREDVANINIPLKNGDILTIQPRCGMRASQIPALDLETQRQLQALRENLNKVCSYMK